MMPVAIIVGAAMLLFGRRLFWVFVAGAGFLFGASLAAEFFQQQEPWLVLAVAVAGGLVGVLLARFAQRIAVAIGGFVAGAYITQAVTVAVPLEGAPPPWVLIIAGGVVGALLLIFLFDWALIMLSSLTGAAVLAEHLPMEVSWRAVAFLIFLMIGLSIQIRQFCGRRTIVAPAPART